MVRQLYCGLGLSLWNILQIMLLILQPLNFYIVFEELPSENVYFIELKTPAHIYTSSWNVFDIECILDIIFSVQFSYSSQMQLCLNGVCFSKMKTSYCERKSMQYKVKQRDKKDWGPVTDREWKGLEIKRIEALLQIESLSRLSRP